MMFIGNVYCAMQPTIAFTVDHTSWKGGDSVTLFRSIQSEMKKEKEKKKKKIKFCASICAP